MHHKLTKIKQAYKKVLFFLCPVRISESFQIGMFHESGVRRGISLEEEHRFRKDFEEDMGADSVGVENETRISIS